MFFGLKWKLSQQELDVNMTSYWCWRDVITLCACWDMLIEFFSLNDEVWAVSCEAWSLHRSIEQIFTFSWDYVEITENGQHPAINRFCGWDPVTYISASNDVIIKFGSDDSYESKGFSFYFEIKGTFFLFLHI